MKAPTRRDFLKKTAISLGFLGLQSCMRFARGGKLNPNLQARGFGPLLDDPKGLMRLPKGFSYTAFSRTGERMDDGYFVPGDHDGMAAFPGPDGTTLLVRNHEVDPGATAKSPFLGDGTLFERARREGHYDPARGNNLCYGGTTTLVFDTRTQTLKQHSLSLVGTLRNCSGGPTPWGSWITCEETIIRADATFEQDHGYCFEVPARATIGLAKPLALKAMGRFNHEAVCVDPKTGIVYQTEDRPDGLIYRFLPNTPGKLELGGTLQALALLDEPSRDTRNWDEAGFPQNVGMPVRWIDLEDIDAPDDDLRFRGFKAGAARFARGEGAVFGNGNAYFACTNGGPKQFGQIFAYEPSPYEGTARESERPGKLTLFIESSDSQLMSSCDNLTVAPWGDVVICEDDGASSAIVGVTPQGKLYTIGHIDMESELAGVCFSPDGTTLFVNAQRNPGQTIAITGPWNTRVG